MPVGPEQREARQETILEIVKRREVTSQVELVRLLRERGVAATQSSVSRDLKELGVVKVGRAYRPAAEAEGSGAAEEPYLAALVREVRTAGPNLIVVTTAVGAAQRVGVHIDRMGWPESVGTLSGDDTVFIATANRAAQRRLVALLEARFGR